METTGGPENREAEDEARVGQIQGQPSPRVRIRRHRNANYLLNFISSSPPATYDHRYNQSSKSRLPSYDPKKFLQANFRFLVSDAIDTRVYESNADLMLDWDDVAQVLYTTHSPICCPITLVQPLCPTITPCGHIFSLEAIIAHMISQGGSELKAASACPLCTSTIAARELRPVVVRIVQRIDRGDCVTFRLVRRHKNGIFLRTANSFSDGEDDFFAKFLLVKDPSDIWKQEIQVLSDALVQVRSEGGEEVCYELPPLLASIESIALRAKYWTARRVRALQERNDGKGSVQADTLQGAEEAGRVVYQRMQEASEQAILVAEIVLEQRRTLKTLDEEFPQLLSLRMQEKSESEENGKENDQDKEEDVLQGKMAPPPLNAKRVEDQVAFSDTDKTCFYQAADGQLIFLGPLNMRMLLEFSKVTNQLPTEFTARILDIEDNRQTEIIRKRYRRTSHLPLGAHFSLCEVDMSTILPPKAIEPFKKEIASRARRRAATKVSKKRGDVSSNHSNMRLPDHDTKLIGEKEEVAVSVADRIDSLKEQHDILASENGDLVCEGAVSVNHSTPSFAHIARMGFAATGPALVEEGARQLSATGNSGVWAKRPEEAQFTSATLETQRTEKPNDVKRAGSSRKSKSKVLLSYSSQRRY